MKKSNPFLAFFVIGIVGTLCHFVYDLSGQNYIVGLFTPVNESTWEHLKLLFFPALIYYTVEYFLRKDKPENFFAATVLSIFAGMLTITVLFYTYSGILGFNVDFINILTYFIGLAVTVILKERIIKSGKYQSKTARFISLFAIVITAVLFFLWSYNPPSPGIFISPV